MPRVPVLDGPSVSPVAQPGYQPRFVRPDTSIAEGLWALGRSTAAAAGAVESHVEKARREAGAVAEADAMLQQQERATRHLMGDPTAGGRINDAFDGTDTATGFLSTRGLAAGQSSAKVLERLEKDRRELAESIADPEARVRFLQRSGEQMLGYRRQVLAHSAKEFEVARDATAKARAEQAIGQAEAGVPDFDSWRVLQRGVEADLRATARSPEEADARVAAFQSTSAAGMVKGLLAQGRVDEASAYVAESRATLAGHYPEAKALVDRALAGATKDRNAAMAVRVVDAAVGDARGEDGYLDEGRLRAAVDIEGAKGEDERQALREELDRRVRGEKARLDADIRKERDNANRADLQRQPIPGATRTFLERHDPDFLLARDARRRAEYRQWKAEKDGTAREKAAAAAQQKAVDEEFLWTLKGRLVDDPNVSPDDVLRDFVVEKARKGDAVTVSDVMQKHAGFEAKSVAQKAETKEGLAELRAKAAFGGEMEKMFAAEGKVKGKPLDQQQLKTRVNKALAAYDDAVRANGDKPLTPEQVKALGADLVSKVDVQQPGRWWGTNTVTRTKVDTLDVPESLPGGVPEAPDAGVAPVVADEMVRVRSKATGKTGKMPLSKFDPARYDLLGAP